jgi:hypothetical protein
MVLKQTTRLVAVGWRLAARFPRIGSTDNTHLDAPKRRSAPSRRLSLAGVILVGVTLIAAGLTIWDRREESIASYRREITNLGTVLAEQTARSMQAVDLVLKEVQAKFVAAGTDNSEEFRRVMETEEVHRFLVSRQETLPQVNAVGLIGADGAARCLARCFNRGVDDRA